MTMVTYDDIEILEMKIHDVEIQIEKLFDITCRMQVMINKGNVNVD
mgnify:CR=1 FL=1